MRYTNRGTVFVALVALAALPTALAAQGSAAEPARAAVSAHAGGVDFQPKVEFSRAILTVSGNGRVYQQTFEPGDRVSIEMFDPGGQVLADGLYTWWLELLPDEATARELRRSAAANGGRAPGAWRAQTGTFAVSGGSIADREIIEPEAANAAPRRGTGLSSAFTPSSFGAPRRTDDGDAAVGSRTGVEAQVNAAASRAAPATATGALVQADRAASDDSDEIATTLGRSLEQAATASGDNQLSAQPHGAVAPRPRSDGSNGRPRSDG